MKTFRLLFSFLLLFSCHQTFASNVKQDVKRALTSLNSQWEEKQLMVSAALQAVDLENEVELIQFHLYQVIEALKRKPMTNYTSQQIKNRTILLATLSAYAHHGKFPQNSFHSSRTPYFIDAKGTACAVGYLLIKSGYESLANEISAAHNYSYLADMPQNNISAWATKHGFTLEELAWIQPSYAPICPLGTIKNPECFDGVGCINPDYASDGLIPPYQFFVEFNDGSGWATDSSQVLFYFGARVGQHRITVSDSLNQVRVYQYTIQNPPPIALNTNLVPQTDSNCNGSITVSASLGTAPYTYQLMRQNPPNFWQDSSGIFMDLCEGDYTLVVYDHKQCQQTTTVKIDRLTTLIERQESTFKLYPLPFQDYLTIVEIGQSKCYYEIYSLKGKLMQSGWLGNHNQIATDMLKEGVYMIQFQLNQKLVSRKIVKAK